MAQDVKLTMDGMLLNWLKDVGDTVKSGEIIAEFEADKATVEVEAPGDGIIVELRVDVGDSRNEGDVIAIIGAAGESAPAKGESAPAKEETKQQAAEAEEAEDAPAASSNGSTTADGRIKASPLAKRVADDKGIDLSQVSGSGPGGRIVKTDVENYKPSAAPAKQSAAPAAASAPAEGVSVGKPTYGKIPEGDEFEVIEVSRMRRAIADSTIISKQMTPHFYVTVDIDVDPLLKLRKQLNDSLEKEGIKISVNDMIVKATALTLKSYPNLNSHYYGDKIVRHKRINVGISVALPNNGLMNVVSPDADKVSLATMAEYHKALFERAREGKIKPSDIRGATFTVSNLGPYNVDHFSAIINPPEAGIIAVGSARKVPAVLADGSLGVRNSMKVTISVDHRVSDGAEGAQWLQTFRELLENPMRLLV